ncbi:MAG: phosphoglycerate kinase [Candidatus Cloacimonetes bacterium]|nr:phosphoglycerate kinase [Candidatus Cloacimonadota bacterium]
MLPKLQDANLSDKIVIMRVDHNVVKKGKIMDTTRIDATISTIVNILRQGGHIILMTHVGRPRDKKTGLIEMTGATDVQPIVDYLERKLKLKIEIPDLHLISEQGFLGIDTSINNLIYDLYQGHIDMIYMPNTRWFAGEESDNEDADKLGYQLAGLADVFVNDAFGSWQPHASTVKIAEYIPAYAGLLMQEEIEHLNLILEPEHPFTAVVAGSKFDTKIGPLKALLEKVDNLILGGVIYNAYLAAKYGISINGIGEKDVVAAKKFMEVASEHLHKIIEPRFVVESDSLESKKEGRFRSHDIHKLKKAKFILDAAPESFEQDDLKKAILGAKTIFVNAVMGLTPNFSEGTLSLYNLIAKNSEATKLFGGGDTIQEFRVLLPGLFTEAANRNDFYFFTGGGTVLKAIEEGTAYGLEPVEVLVANKEEFFPDGCDYDDDED